MAYYHEVQYMTEDAPFVPSLLTETQYSIEEMRELARENDDFFLLSNIVEHLIEMDELRIAHEYVDVLAGKSLQYNSRYIDEEIANNPCVLLKHWFFHYIYYLTSPIDTETGGWLEYGAFIEEELENNSRYRPDESADSDYDDSEESTYIKVRGEHVKVAKSDENCSICLEDMEIDLVKTKCGHIFHKDCLSRVRNDNCPLCRSSIE